MNRQKQIVRASARGEREGKRERASEREREREQRAGKRHAQLLEIKRTGHICMGVTREAGRSQRMRERERERERERAHYTV